MAGVDIVETLRLHAEPTVVLINVRADEALEGCLSEGARGEDGGKLSPFGSCSWRSC